MSEKPLTKEKFILQLICVIAAVSLLFVCFLGIDRYHERYVKVKLAELGFNPYEQTNKEIK
jgi:hypothetical protein